MAKPRDVLIGDPPARDIASVIDLIGPRGGMQYVLMLTCGHWVMHRKLPNKTSVNCVGCLVEAALKERKQKR